MLNLTPYDLSVDRLDVHAVSLVFTVLLTIQIEYNVLEQRYISIPTHPKNQQNVYRVAGFF